MQRFSWLVAERPQARQMYEGSVTKSCSSFDFESGEKLQILVASFVDFFSVCFRSDIVTSLVANKRVNLFIKFNFIIVNR
jgi:hypothetical protein